MLGKKVVLKYPKGRSAKNKIDQTGVVTVMAMDLMIVKFEDNDEIICTKSEVALIIEIF